MGPFTFRWAVPFTPMLEAHYIQFICLVTDKGVYFRNLRPEQAPKPILPSETKNRWLSTSTVTCMACG